MNTLQAKAALIALVAASIASAPGAFAKGGGGNSGGGSHMSSGSNSGSSHASSASNSGGSKSFSNYRSYRYSGPPVCVRWERQNCVAWSN